MMDLPLFVFSTADSEGVPGVLTIGTYCCCRAITTRLTKYSKTTFAFWEAQQIQLTEGRENGVLGAADPSH
jgi:hypothetical protein